MAVGVAAVAAGYSIYSNQQAGQAQQEIADQNAAALKLQGAELSKRDAINREITKKEGENYVWSVTAYSA